MEMQTKHRFGFCVREKMNTKLKLVLDADESIAVIAVQLYAQLFIYI